VVESVTVIFETHEGKRFPVRASIGASLMQAAIQHNIPGIEAECGGSCICATCHVYVDADRFADLDGPEEMEAEMLDSAAAERRANSRLSCQITVDATLDGAVIRVPETQF